VILGGVASALAALACSVASLPAYASHTSHVASPAHIQATASADGVTVRAYPEARASAAYVIVSPTLPGACLSLAERPAVTGVERVYLSPRDGIVRVSATQLVTTADAARLDVTELVIDTATRGAIATGKRSLTLGSVSVAPAGMFAYRDASSGDVHLFFRVNGRSVWRDARTTAVGARSSCAHAELVLSAAAAREGGATAELAITDAAVVSVGADSAAGVSPDAEGGRRLHVSASLSQTTTDREPVLGVVVNTR
jgi:hypothetical protein